MRDAKSKEADVSVVVPCYNSASTVGRAIASIANQTLLPAEVIVVDDGSKDDTLSVLREMASRYPKDWIKVVALGVNGGPGEARNAGWAAASQKYVAFLDADDVWHPQKIEIQYQWMEKHPDFVLSGHDMLQVVADKALPFSFCDIGLMRWCCVTKFKLLWKNYFSTPTIMVVRNVPYRFAPKKSYAEDYLLWLQIACKGLLLAKINVPLAFMFKAPYGEGGLSAKLLKMQLGEIDVYRRVRDDRKINFLTYLALIFWSLIRFVKRFAVVGFKKSASRIKMWLLKRGF